MKKYLLFFALIGSIIGFSQSYLQNPTIPCKSDSLFDILELEPVINGQLITDSNDLVITGVATGVAIALPESSISGTKVDISSLDPTKLYGVSIYSNSQQAEVITNSFRIYDMSGTMTLMENQPGHTTAEFCQSQILEMHFEHTSNVDSLLYFIDYGDGTLDTLESLSTAEHKYSDTGVYQVNLAISSVFSSCSLTYRNNAVVTPTNGLRIGTIVSDTVTCIGDKDGQITLHSEFGGLGPKTFAFSDGNYSSTRAWDKLGAGYYKISVKDSVGCIADTNVRIANPNPIKYTTAILLPECDSSVMGEVMIDSVKGGWGEYVYSWNDSIHDSIYSAVQFLDTIVLKITDKKGCYKTETIVMDTCSGIMPEGVGVEELELFGVAVYPNPAEGQYVTIQSQTILESVSCFDLIGSQLFNRTIDSRYLLLDVADLHTGVYFIEIHPKGKSAITKKLWVK